ncbi:MAG: response regulator transcription factor [Maricaulaceae bacterium]|jgi:two-component system OmpR family response regulator
MRLLVVEDDPDLNRQLVETLTDAGYAVDSATDGIDGRHLGETEPYDAAVLDLGLPELDGVSVLRAWRADGRDFPVLILTARDQWAQKVSGFDAGADDYVTKPFHTEELLARLRALLRRSSGHASSMIEAGALSVDTRAAKAYIAGAPVKLTSHEFKLLRYMVHHVGEVISRSELIEHIYDQDFDRDSNTIEVFIGRLRKKIGPERIETVRGLGYRLVDPDSGA